MVKASNTLKSLLANCKSIPVYAAAPMVDQSDLAYRQLVHRYGANLLFTQMIHCNSYANKPAYRCEVNDWRHTSDDRPLLVQLAGSDVKNVMESALRIQEDGVDGIDLNLGCPQGIAKRGNYGAYFLEETERVVELLTKMCQSLHCLVTAKIRLYDDISRSIKLCQRLQDAGVAMITVHGRTKVQNKQYSGAANWDAIAEVVRSVSIPVLANGGIGSLGDVRRCLAHTGAAGVMSSEALLENPCLFSDQFTSAIETDYITHQLDVAEEYYSLAQASPLSSIRGHLFKFLYAYLQARRNHDLRQRLGKCQKDETKDILGTLRQRLEKINFDRDEAIKLELLCDRRWYMRHRDSFSNIVEK